MKFIIFSAIIAVALAGPLNDDTRITNGLPAVAGQFPHMVAVRHSGTLICGGALIAPTWVLTSAECVWHYNGSEHDYSIYAGGLSILSSPETGRVELFVASVHPHPKFRMNERDTLYYYNIGLIQLNAAAPIGANIQIAQLPASGAVVPNGTGGILTGWGGTNSRVSPVLQYATMTTMDIVACSESVGGSHEFTSAQICTNPNPGPSACWYDHGGPLIQPISTGGRTVIGVTAYAGCLDPSHPTIYTNPGFPEYRAWITQLTGV